VAKSRPGQLHHAPNPDTQYGKQYAALQAERQGIRDERRENHETLQAIKDAERRTSAALAELDERIAQVTAQRVIWADLESATRDRMHEVMRGVIAAEIETFREQLQKSVGGVASTIENARTAIIQAEAEVLGFKHPNECLDYIAEKVMAMIKADVAKRIREPADGLILEIVTTKKERKDASAVPPR